MPGLQETTEQLSLLADPTRVRLLALLDGEELTVAELTRITALPQSRVSTHLGRLRESALVRDRRHGTSTYYAAAMEGPLRLAWDALLPAFADARLDDDRRRREEVLRTRDEAGSWVDTVAGQMERHYSPGRTWEATTRGLLGFLRLGDVLDLGCGDGVVASLVKERARSLTCLDRSARALAAARERLGADPLVTFVEGDMEALPLPSASFDQVLLLHVLTCTRDPAQALAEAARVLRPGARLCVVTLAEHHHADLVAAFDHLHCGFSPSGLRQLLGAAGLTVETCEVTSRERRQPYFEVLTAVASRPGDGP